MPPLLENSTNTSGHKRKPDIESDDEIMEGGAAEWHAARTLPKKPKMGPSAPLESRQDSETMLDESDLRGRGLQRSGDSSSDVVHQILTLKPTAQRTKWRADPSKLPPKKKGKKLKYYGVLFGKRPGIYYSWDEAEPQVKGVTRAVYIASTEAQEIEDFMNHKPAVGLSVQRSVTSFLHSQLLLRRILNKQHRKLILEHYRRLQASRRKLLPRGIPSYQLLMMALGHHSRLETDHLLRQRLQLRTFVTVVIPSTPMRRPCNAQTFHTAQWGHTTRNVLDW